MPSTESPFYFKQIRACVCVGCSQGKERGSVSFMTGQREGHNFLV